VAQENLGLLEPCAASGERKAGPRPRKAETAAIGAGGGETGESPFPGKKARVASGGEDEPIEL
jgi:hypothetical protein